jgi:hypothetical protein
MKNKKPMRIPKGYTEQQIVNIITDIGNKIAPNFTFGYYDKDDIKQEIFIFGLEALKRFKPDKGELSSFLSKHIKNRLLNLKRDKVARHSNDIPCNDCESKTDDCDRDSCSIFYEWVRRNAIKRSLMQPAHLGIDLEEYVGIYLDKKMEIDDLIAKIDMMIPAKYREDYCRYVEGCKMSSIKKQNIISLIKNILEQELENG